MDRSALLKLIHKDLNELQLLLQGMEGYNEIPEPIIRLAKSKGSQLIESINLLPGEVRVAIHETVESEYEDDQIEEVVSETVQSEIKEEQHFETIDENVLPEPEEEVQEIKETEPAINEVNKLEFEEAEAPLIDDKPEPMQAKKISVLGETINGGEKLMDKIKKDVSGSLGAKLEGAPIKDMTKAININDRYMFQKELFDNNRDEFQKCLEALNNLSSFDDALEYLISTGKFDFDSEISKRFLSLVNRRYK